MGKRRSGGRQEKKKKLKREKGMITTNGREQWEEKGDEAAMRAWR
jgi:hypothetical protein